MKCKLVNFIGMSTPWICFNYLLWNVNPEMECAVDFGFSVLTTYYEM